MLGPRHALGSPSTNFAAHDVTHVVIGTVFLWVGWFGFNAGSANAANLRAVMAAVVTNLAACVGGIIALNLSSSSLLTAVSQRHYLVSC